MAAEKKVPVWLNPTLITIIGFFSIYTLSGVNARLDKLEAKVDELMLYKVPLQRLIDGSYKVTSLPPFKHEDFITLKIVNDEGNS
jgi:hypothetical protein